MAAGLIHQRCLVHPGRRAAAQCPQCRHLYCRECVTEHAGRMICAHCISALESSEQGRRFSIVIWGALSLGGLMLAWLVFYYVGMGLANIPSTFQGGAP